MMLEDNPQGTVQQEEAVDEEEVEEEGRADRMVEFLMVVAGIGIPLTYYMGARLWQTTAGNYTVGTSILAHTDEMSYYSHVIWSSSGLSTCLSMILLQVSVFWVKRTMQAWVLTGFLVVCILFSYKIAAMSVTPKKIKEEIGGMIYTSMGIGATATCVLVVVIMERHVWGLRLRGYIRLQGLRLRRYIRLRV